MSLVSIIIPVHNGEEYIDKCVKSAINQTYKNIEVLLINDGSIDSSGLMCDSYSLEYKQVKTFHILNSGPSGARNIGIKNCNGDLIYFLDADDTIEPNTIELLIEQQEKHGVDWVIGDFRRVTNGIKSTSGIELNFSDDTYLNETDILDYLRKYLKISYKHLLFNHIWNKLYKADIIKNNGLKFNIELRNLEDIDFNFKYLNYVRSAFFKNVPLYNYTIRTSSQSSVIGDNLRDVTKYPATFDTIKAFLHSKSLSDDDIEKEVGHFFISYVIIILIRLCGNWNFKNSCKIYRNAAAIIRSPEVRKNLQFYSPTAQDIKFVHILIKFKLDVLVMLVCRRRYKKHRKSKGAQK